MKQISIALLFALFSTSAAAAGLSKKQVREVVRPIESEVAECAQRAGVGGTVRVRFTVKPDGSPANTRVVGNHRADAGGKCAVDAINGLRFPESSKGRAAKWRFQLGKAGGEGGHRRHR